MATAKSKKMKSIICSPSGTWKYFDLMGAKVRLRSLPVSEAFGMMCSGQDSYTIEDIMFRIDLSGKGITIVKLKEFPDRVFTFRDLEIVSLNPQSRTKAICGTFTAGNAITGRGVSHDPSWEKVNGIALIDENGNIVTDRYVRIANTDTEDINTDLDNITDLNVNFNGEILD